MNLREGTRRLALLLGVVGAILGGVVSYLELQTVLQQRARHNRFEQLANSDVVQQARASIEVSESGPSQNPPPAKFDWSVVRICPSETGKQYLDDNGNPIPAKADRSGCYTEVDRGGIKTIHWTKDLRAESIETEDVETLYPTAAPAAWEYLLVALFPILGFFIPWGAVRATGWVGAGFTQSSN
jgi:hypothetical protein